MEINKTHRFPTMSLQEITKVKDSSAKVEFLVERMSGGSDNQTKSPVVRAIKYFKEKIFGLTQGKTEHLFISFEEYRNAIHRTQRLLEIIFTFQLEDFYSKVEQSPGVISPKIHISFKPPKSDFVVEDQILIEGLDLNKYDTDNSCVYIGNKHNPIDILEWEITKISKLEYKIIARIKILFSIEQVAKDEEFTFETNLQIFPEFSSAL